MPYHLSLDALANPDFILLAVGTRFFTSLVTLIGAMWSLIQYGNLVRNPGSNYDNGTNAAVILIFIFFSFIFMNDISSLPVNIFYFWSILSGADL